jgi:ureidoglycolate lyase
MVHLRIQDLTPAAFAPFGHVITSPTHHPDASGPGWQWWGEMALLAADSRPYGVGYLALRPTEPRFDWAERHMHSAEMLIPAGGDCLVYVGPPDHLEEPGCLPALDRFQIFRVYQGQAVLLHAGVWHGAPLAIDRPLNVVVLLLQGSGASDTSVVRFEETPVHIDKERVEAVL